VSLGEELIKLVLSFATRRHFTSDRAARVDELVPHSRRRSESVDL